MIRFENVKKQFGSKEVLKGINFEVNEGEILFILGTSGTGKSVLLKNIVGLLKPTSGQIWIHKEEVSLYTEKQFFEVRKNCGMVFQHPALFDSLSIFENIAYGLRRHYFQWGEQQYIDRVSECIKLVNLSGLDLSLKPQDISYGMQKRVSMARTIALKPKVLLFDEPTTGLDPVTTTAINQLIFSMSRGLKTTSLVVSHDMKCALDIADKIIVLDKGFVVDSGTTNEIKQSQHPLVRDFLLEVLDE